jgi:hypothetical protein
MRRIRRDAALVLTTAAASFAVAAPLGLASHGASKEDIYPSWPGTTVTFVGLDWTCLYSSRHTVKSQNGKRTTFLPQINCNRESTEAGVSLAVTGASIFVSRTEQGPSGAVIARAFSNR